MRHKTPARLIGNAGDYAKEIDYKNPDPKTGEIPTFVIVPIYCDRGRNKRIFYVKIFGKKAEKALKIRKGDLVTVEGIYDPQAYIDKDGKAQVAHEVLVTGNQDHCAICIRQSNNPPSFTEQMAAEAEAQGLTSPEQVADEGYTPPQGYDPTSNPPEFEDEHEPA